MQYTHTRLQKTQTHVNCCGYKHDAAVVVEEHTGLTRSVDIVDIVVVDIVVVVDIFVVAVEVNPVD